MPIPTKAARRIRATGKPEIFLVKAAGKAPMMAVYSADGELVGLVSPDDVQPVQSPGNGDKPSQAEIEAQAAKVQQQHTANVAKAMQSFLHSQPKKPPVPAGSVVKKAATMDEQWTQLMAAVGSSHATAISAMVGREAYKLFVNGGAADSGRATTLMKRAAVQYAVNRDLI